MQFSKVEQEVGQMLLGFLVERAGLLEELLEELEMQTQMRHLDCSLPDQVVEEVDLDLRILEVEPEELGDSPLPEEEEEEQLKTEVSLVPVEMELPALR
jgi:hypothetical protein